ncbi:ESX secretion-associated protein EspG, partial [Rhodococcus chondri]
MIGPRGVFTTPDLLGPVVVTAEQLQVLVERVAVAEMPVVLDHRHDHDTADSLTAALAAAEESLVARGLLRSGQTHPELGDRVRILGRPRGEIAVRRCGEDGVGRLCGAPDSAGRGVSDTAER